MDDLGLMISSEAPERQAGPDLPGGFGAIGSQAQWAEEHGFAGIWMGEGRLANNAIVPITLIAAHTKRINVGSGILPYRTRNPALMAVTWKTLDGLAPGRMRLGLGAWWEPLATRCGLPNSKPLKAMLVDVGHGQPGRADDSYVSCPGIDRVFIDMNDL